MEEKNLQGIYFKKDQIKIQPDFDLSLPLQLCATIASRCW